MGGDSSVFSFGVVNHRQCRRGTEFQQAVKDFRYFVGVGLHRITVVAGLHVHVNAGQHVPELVNADGDVDSRMIGRRWVKLLLTRFAFDHIARSVKHVQHVIGFDLGFFIAPRETPHVAAKQGVEARSRGFQHVKRPRCKAVCDGKCLATRGLHGLRQHTGVLFELDLGVANHGPCQSFFERHADAIGQVVRLINDDDDVLQRQVHGLEAGIPHAVVKQVIVITHKHVSTAHSLSGGLPRTGLSGFAVNRVRATDVDQFIHVKRAGKNAFFESGGSGDPRFA